MNSMKVTVVIPAFNEARTISDVVRAVRDTADDVVVVDDASADATGDRARAAGAHVLRHEPNGGYDASLNDGFACAAERGADVIVTCDADGQHRAEDISRLVAPILRNEADIVLSVRPRLMRLGERVFAAYTNWRYGIRDPLSGMKAYRRSVYDRLGHFDTIRSIGTQLSVEAVQLGERLAFVPITIIPRTHGDASRFYVRRLRGNLRIIGACLRLMFHHVKGDRS
jgi:glycosyltransferase involved in cell wall biosynthesis